MTNNLTPEMVWNRMVELADNEPDFVYTDQEGQPLGDVQCGYLGMEMYSTEGRGCIVGQALASLGVTEKELLEFEGFEAYSVIEGLHIGEADDPVVQKITQAQSYQDLGITWSVAIERSEKEIENERY